jgi:predicted dehydrogenase
MQALPAFVMLTKEPFPKAIKAAMEVNPSVTPKSEKDCRKVLEDKTIDAIFIATPDHWHAPLTIMGCQAGKHVYVEKPLSHNPHEGELAVEAARKYNRVVQMGAQRRSAPILTQGIEKLHEGIIGRVYTWQKHGTPTRANPLPELPEMFRTGLITISGRDRLHVCHIKKG